ncbi:Oxysterol-binding protein-domain-containing protein [Amylocarpus encephaloides]|uniref:Oxysterol-binding protein-domain-containing protein n=1 Tax=Amylocarpus encephaloides TaxID=45428 RepID=A0A9P8C1D3_9HELO|nr:Oxysterol-binding protein-domain-containing protein [Amylocarpus encephaloides]
MSEAGEGHKRSKSSALSILRRKDTKDEDNASEEGSTSHHHSPSNHISRGHYSKPSTGTAGLMRSASNVAVQRNSMPPPTQAQDKTVSIEQSVRKFRIFEALRSGDSAAVAKAIHDTESGGLEDTTILHLAIQCAEQPVIEYILTEGGGSVDVNARDKEGNTALHLAAQQGRTQAVRFLLDQNGINDSIANYQRRLPLDLARTPDIFQQLQLSRSIFVDGKIRQVQALVQQGDYKRLGEVLEEPRVKTVLDINGGEFASDIATMQSGGTLLHEAARKKNTALIQVLLLHGADPFRRDRRGKLPQDVTKDDQTRSMLKRSPAAVAAQRGIQEKAVLGNASQQAAHAAPGDALAGKEGREMKGYLKKWTNYRKGLQLRWFVLEDGVMSYYKHQDDAGSACRGAINMRIARLNMDPTEKTKFEIIGKSSVKYHLKANHEVEAKRWFWALNNSIQWTKDQAKEEEKQQQRSAELLRQAKAEHASSGSLKDPSTNELVPPGGETVSIADGRRSSSQTNRLLPTPSKNASASRVAFNTSGSVVDDDDGTAYGSYEPSFMGDIHKSTSHLGPGPNGEDDDEYGDADGSSDREAPATKDAFDITAQSAKMQLDMMAQVNAALQSEQSTNPTLNMSDSIAIQAVQTYDSSIRNLKGLVGDLLKISKDRDAYWQYRLDREADMRRMWEDSMAKVAQEQEVLEARVDEAEEKRKITKRALREVMEGNVAVTSRPSSRGEAGAGEVVAKTLGKAGIDKDEVQLAGLRRKSTAKSSLRRKSVMEEIQKLSESESEDDEEFFDAVDAGEVEVAPMPVVSPPEYKEKAAVVEKEKGGFDLSPSFQGYEDGIRTKLKMDADDRPKISLWGILKSMIGKDMTKMTLPVSFNEPTSLLQRCAEDMEYADLLDIAAARPDSTERMVYVAAFAASEYASTIGRVAKPFNPLLGETFEYARPDKNYRFFIEQVSHHPPVGAAWAESPKWTYYGESAVKSKFYGKSFDINPLGTWFLKLRPDGSEKEELYTWKKVTSSVIGIITGSPTVDNYGPMEVKNWTTGEVCVIDFKARGWKASSAYHISGRVNDADGKPRYSIGGRWNNKIYARLTPGYEATPEEPKPDHRGSIVDTTQAFLVWEANARPTGIPFNLTPFVVTLNDCNDRLKPWLPPTDTRLRPDQRAMEDGEYDLAATEKNRVEEKQRDTRRKREEHGEEFQPKWFHKAQDPTTGESYWQYNGMYWKERENAGSGEAWRGVDKIF